MKSFIQYLEEMPQLFKPDDGEDEHKAKDEHLPKPKANSSVKEKDHGLASDGEHRIVSQRSRTSKSFTYYATHPKHSGMQVEGDTTKDNHFAVRYVSRHKNSGLGGDNFYKDILKTGEHKGIESDEGQSEGGAKIWHRLAHNHPDVEVTRHNLSGKKLPLYKGKDWHKNFIGETDSDSKNSVFRARLKPKRKSFFSKLKR